MLQLDNTLPIFIKNSLNEFYVSFKDNKDDKAKQRAQKGLYKNVIYILSQDDEIVINKVLTALNELFKTDEFSFLNLFYNIIFMDEDLKENYEVLFGTISIVGKFTENKHLSRDELRKKFDIPKAFNKISLGSEIGNKIENFYSKG